ncbi:MAG TPA: hypothetical protein VFV57_11840, partial [Limnobacter sp.]|nr:hypothetical protein [Limnobacter sp.]
MPLEASPSFVRAVDTHYDNQSKLRNLSGLLGEVKQEAESAARIAKSLRNIAQAHVQSGRLHLITKSGEQIATKALEASLDKAKHTLKKVGFEFDLLKGHV